MGRDPIIAEAGDGYQIAAQPLSQAEIVEGLMGDCIREIKNSVDVLFYNPGLMEERTNAMASRAIAMAEIQALLQMMHGIHDSGFGKKHRMCRDVLRQMHKRLVKNRPGDEAGNKWDLARFGRDLVDFLTSFHRVLAEDTPPRLKSDTWRRFCRGQTVP